MTKEQTVIAYFPSSTKADSAVKALSAAGMNDVHIKRASRYGVSLDNRINDPRQSQSLTGLTIFSTDNFNDANQANRILMGADPAVSGMSAHDYGTAGGSAFSLIAFVPEERVDECVNIIKQNGGKT